MLCSSERITEKRRSIVSSILTRQKTLHCSMKKILLFSGIVALLVSSASLAVYHYALDRPLSTVKIEHISGAPARGVGYTIGENGEPVLLDFTKVAETAMQAVVHVKSTAVKQRARSRSPFDDFFGSPFERYFNFPDLQPSVGTGSGVIIASDGYIVTNHHVIANAEDIEVTLYDNRTYKAIVVGSDPTTDLALLQIKEKNLPTIPFANSDAVRVGEWVLAVGNPFNLTSTVTAGIVSAKARNINILREQFAVESFIQTDAAINPGNSGGALVNLEGGLIGINTAIASNTGSYAGYGFAVPSNIVSKVVEDLMQYGMVQRGVLGVMVRNVDGNLAREKGLEVTQGAYVDSLLENSAAGVAGIKPGDVIVSIDDAPVTNSSTLQELVARHRPGDVVKVKVNRKGTTKTFDVRLTSRSGKTTLTTKNSSDGDVLDLLGIELEAIDKKTAQRLEIEGGLRVKSITEGKIRRSTSMREGFIITHLDGKPVTDVDTFVRALRGRKGGVMLEGIYEDKPGVQYYAFGM